MGVLFSLFSSLLFLLLTAEFIFSVPHLNSKEWLTLKFKLFSLFLKGFVFIKFDSSFIIDNDLFSFLSWLFFLLYLCLILTLLFSFLWTFLLFLFFIFISYLFNTKFFLVKKSTDFLVVYTCSLFLITLFILFLFFCFNKTSFFSFLFSLLVVFLSFKVLSTGKSLGAGLKFSLFLLEDK